jgi:hypothetical protein
VRKKRRPSRAADKNDVKARPWPSIGAWSRGKKLEELIIAALLGVPLTCLLFVAVVNALSWTTQHDLPIMMYTAFLFDEFGLVPHRDVFDMNMPGTHLAYLWIGKLFGYGDQGLRWADSFLLAVILGLTVLMLRRLGHRVAWLAAAMFGLAYIYSGSWMSLQREFLLLIPLLLAVLAAVSVPGEHFKRRVLVAGICLGCAATIKPHALIGLVPIFTYLWTEGWENEKGTKQRLLEGLSLAGYMLAGIAVPVTISMIVLAVTGALGGFVSTAVNYLPLYGAMNGNYTVIDGHDRAVYLVDKVFELGEQGELRVWAVFAAAAVGFYLQMANPSREQRRQVLLMASLAFVFALYPMFSGQFWFYHWLPLLYWLAILSSLLVAELPGTVPVSKRWVPVAVFALLAFFLARPDKNFEPLFPEVGLDKYGRPHEIAEYIGLRLGPGDTVQPLDWTGTGVVHALLMAKAKLATPFMYDFHFYHHVSTGYNRELRARFMAALRESSPKFVVVGKVGPFPQGEDTDRSFPELSHFINEYYRVVVEKPRYVILERS